MEKVQHGEEVQHGDRERVHVHERRDSHHALTLYPLVHGHMYIYRKIGGMFGICTQCFIQMQHIKFPTQCTHTHMHTMHNIELNGKCTKNLDLFSQREHVLSIGALMITRYPWGTFVPPLLASTHDIHVTIMIHVCEANKLK